MLLPLVLMLFAYLLGSLSSAIIVCKLVGMPDPRTQGSGNPGASNVLRLAGKRLAGIVLLADMIKGWIPVMLAKFFALPLSLLAWVAFFAFIGHLFPVFFNFRGGKGVATALGGLLALAWPIGFVAFLSWLIVVILLRYISIASITAVVLTFFYVFYVYSFSVYLPILLMSVLLIARHYSNIRRLIKGVEPKLNKSALSRK